MVTVRRSSGHVVDLTTPCAGSAPLLADLLAADIVHLDRVRRDEGRRRAEVRIRKVLVTGSLTMVWQPIVDLVTGEDVGYEALARIPGPPDQPPDRWFAEAVDVGLGEALEMMAVRAALEGLPDLPAHAYLAINVSPDLIRAPALAAVLAAVPGERIVLEMTEHAPIDQYEALNVGIERHRAAGVRMAADDVGAGFASLRHILRLRPEIMKLDATLTRGIDADPARRSLAAAMARFAADLGACLVAEGIERPGELDALREAGVRFGQGFHLALPGSLPGTGSGSVA
jgi:EAL domain-containing protein (putative c-di-GMP-specific phosphodiesterase class I)